MTMQELIQRFSEVANNPNAYVVDWKNRTGKPAVGVMPPFAPEEVVYACGALPVGLWGAPVNPTDAFQYLPTFYCSILTTVLQMGIQGSYRELAAFVCNTGCDGLQDLMEDWKTAVPTIPMLDCIYPQRRNMEASRLYMVDELRHFSKRLTAITGHKATDLDLQDAMHTYNDHNAAMREFSLVACDHLDVVTPLVRHDVFKSAHTMDKKEHTALVSEFIAQLKALPKFDFKGIKVVTTGIIMDSVEMLKMLEENNIGIVGDDIVAESKRYETDIENGIDLYYQLAKQWTDRRGCCILQDEKKERAPMLIEVARQRGADGVIVCSLKFCEPDAYDYPIIHRIFADSDLPELRLEVENQYSNDQQAATRIEAFREMLGK